MIEICWQEVFMNSRFMDDSLTWRKLCRAAALEQNPEKLTQIVRKISSALEARKRRLRRSSEIRLQNLAHIASRLDRAA